MKRSRRIAYIATFIALIFVSLMLDTTLGLFMPVNPAIFSLPTVFTFALMFGSLWYAALGGVVFGLLSFARAFITGSLPFQNPLVSVLPRAIVGFVIFGAYVLGKKLFAKSRKNEIYAIGFASFLGVLTNTLTVLFMMYFTDFTTLSGVFAAMIGLNFPIEIVATTLLTPALVTGVRRGLKITLKPKKNANADKENGGYDE